MDLDLVAVTESMRIWLVGANVNTDISWHFPWAKRAACIPSLDSHSHSMKEVLSYAHFIFIFLNF